MEMSPKVFVSHASEDKERFVIEFATRLRSKGIDAWVDKWEIKLGDSLVDKIFEEGLKNAEAVIIVLSQYSINKKWVKEELNASIVSRINKGLKIIPIVIDDCEVPESLQSTVWERISDLNDYDESLNSVVDSIFGHSEKPPLGEPPKYVQLPIENIPGFTRAENLVLKTSCDRLCKDIDRSFFEPEDVFLKPDPPLIPKDQLIDALDILERNGYIKTLQTLGVVLDTYSVTSYGLEEYARAYYADYDTLQTQVIGLIVNSDSTDN